MSCYFEQHAEYSEHNVNFSEQHAMWFLYRISSSAACSFGVWTLEIADHGLPIWLFILVMNKTNGKMKKMEQENRKWGNMSTDPGPLGGLCDILFPKKYNNKVHVAKGFFYHRVWY